MKYILEAIPNKFANYYEPFLGGASVFLNMDFDKKAFINDYTPDLVNVYKQVETNHSLIVEALITLRQEYKVSEDKRKFFFDKRDVYNTATTSDLERAVLFIFINKTCFNGKMTFRKDKTLGSAFGKHNNPGIFVENNLLEFAQILNNDRVHLTNLDYEKCVESATAGDFIYLDPPYVPDDKSKFNYNYVPGESAWKQKDFERLFNCFEQLDKKGCFVMMSNSYSELIRQRFENSSFKVILIELNRGLAGDKNARGKKTEVLIINY